MKPWVWLRDTVIRFWTWVCADPDAGVNRVNTYRQIADLWVLIDTLRADLDALAASVTADVDRIDAEIAALKDDTTS